MSPVIPMLWAACYLALFGSLKVGEMVVPESKFFYYKIPLCVEDTAVDDPNCSTVVRVSIKQLKMNPFRKGVDFFLGRTGTDRHSPVVALLNYLVTRGMASGLLFLFGGGTYLTQ